LGIGYFARRIVASSHPQPTLPSIVLVHNDFCLSGWLKTGLLDKIIGVLYTICLCPKMDDSAAKSKSEPQRAQRTQRFPLYFFVIFVFFAVKKAFRSGMKARWNR
jgi:hypothetical protein